MQERKLIVIGGGPAGIMAALAASSRGISTTLLEATPRLCNKLRITGKGRCNLTNAGNDHFENIIRNPRFMRSAYAQWDAQALMDYMEKLGVPLKVERGMRVFPQDDRAASIAEALIAQLKAQHVRVVTKARVLNLSVEHGMITGVILEDGRSLSADACIVATGGVSYPVTGSTGDGYVLAAQAGHTVETPLPSLAPIQTKEAWVKGAMGLSLRNVELTAFLNHKKVFSERGEMLFTDTGVTGPLVLSASAHLDAREDCKLRLDLKPALSMEQLDARLIRIFSEHANKQFKNALAELLPKSLIPIYAEMSGLAEKPCNQITKAERSAFCTLLKQCELHVKGIGPIEQAVVTRGGVRVSEINPKTMASKLVPNLYFAGEVLDVDAYTGGYNLQIAFSTGYAAGRNCEI